MLGIILKFLQYFFRFTFDFSQISMLYKVSTKNFSLINPKMNF
ncbi:hypothetical protein MCC93_04100 [Morococcus cerebrosus]|uniref:Uncharacterized protein n=1 Tax=Morococcus cerebrosus TaxID=1056807 RepID=A0A0C1H2M5_9NEIS|nr:hypothetical protein MCC93_04100 [Morococcus cerebrosus]